MSSQDIASLALRVDSLEARNAARDLNHLEQQGRRTETGMNSLGVASRALQSAIAAIGIGMLARDMLKTIESVQNMEIRLKGLTSSAKDYAAVQGDLVRVSQQHHKNILTLSDAYSRLLSVESTGIITRQQSIKILEGMSNAQSKTGATIDALKLSAIGLTQALSMGTVAWEEMKQVTEPIPGLMNNIANAAGYTGQTAVGSFKEVVSQSLVTSDMFGRIMVEALEKYQGAAEKAGETLTAQYADISNAWTELASVLEEPVSDVLTPLLHGISIAVQDLAMGFNGLGVQIDNVLKSSRLDGIKSIISKVTEVNTGGASASWGETGGATAAWGETKGGGKTIKDEIDANKQLADAIKAREKAEKSAHSNKASHAAGHASVAKGMSEEQKAAQELARAYENLDDSLRKQLALSKMTDNKQAALEYDLESGALKNLSEAKKLYLLQTSAEIENNKLASQENETKKSEMDALIDKYNQLTLSARDYYKTKLEGEGIKGSAQEPLLKQYDKNTTTEINTAKFNESSTILNKYASELDNVNSSMEALGATSNDVFSAANGGASQVIGAFNAMVTAINANASALSDLAKKQKEVAKAQPDMDKDKYLKSLETKSRLTEKYAKEEKQLQDQTVNTYLDGISNIAGAMGAMYQDNQAAQIAMQAIQGVTLMVQAGIAIASAASGGDGYTALARAAAMAAFMATVISQYGGGAGGGAISAPPSPPNSADTGSVLGDKTAQSQSVTNVTDLLKSIHAEEYTELRGINRGVTQLAGGILNAVTKTFQTGAITGTQAPHLGMSKYKLVSGGLSTGQVGLEDLLAGNADIAGQMFTTEQHQTGSKKKPKFSFKDYFSPMEEGVTESLKGMFSGIGNTLKGVSDQLGKDIGKDLGKNLSAAIIPALKIDIIGLSGEDAVKKVNAVISTAMDTVATQVFGDIIGQYQQLGEGMLETAIRIVSEVAVVRDALNQSGMKMGKNAIALSDSLVQAAGGLEQFQQQFEEFYDKFFTDTEKQSRLQTRLNETFSEVYMLLPRTREEYRKVMESLKLSNAQDRERYSLMLQLSGAADQYYGGLESKVQAASSSNSDRVQLEIQLMKLSGDAAGALAKERELELAAMDKSLRSLQKLIYSLTDYTSALESSYNKAAGLLTSTFTKFFTLAKSLVQYRDALKVGDLSTGSPGSKYQANKDAFESVRDIIKSGPGKGALSEQRYQNALESLQGVSEKFLASSRDYNASGKNYANDYNNVLKTLTSGANKSLDIASDAEKQLNALNDVVSGISELNLSFISLDGSIKQVSSDIWQSSKVASEKAFLNATTISDENKKALGQDGVLGALKGNGVLTALMKDGVIKALGTSGLLGALGQKGVLGALGKNGVLGALGKEGVLGALSSKDGIKGLLASGGPIADALGQKGVLGALGENKPLLKALGADGVLGALGQKGVLGALGEKGILKALGKDGVLKALGTQGVMGALTGNGGVKASLTGTGSVASAVNLVRDAINGTGSVKGGGLNGAIDDVSKSIDNLNGSAGIKGAVESVHDAIKGLTTAIASISKLQADRDKVMADAAKAEAKAAADRAKAQKALDDKRAADQAAKERAAKKAQYDKVSERSSFSSINELFKVSGVDQQYSKGTSDWAKSLIGSFDSADSMKTLVDMAYLLEEFRLFSTGKDTGHAGAWYANEFQKLRDREQSHANGLEFVPYDGYKATLHQGERVQTRHNANADNEETNRIYKEILLELKAANKQRGAVAMELIKKYDKLIMSGEAQTRAIRQGQVS